MTSDIDNTTVEWDLEVIPVPEVIIGTNIYAERLDGDLMLVRQFATEELAEKWMAEESAWSLFDAEISTEFRDHYEAWLRLKAEETGVQASLIHELVGLDVRGLRLSKTHNTDRSLR